MKDIFEHPNPPVLTATNLSVGYTSPGMNKILFRDLNLHLDAGNLVCFMGPNGVGKSTLIRTIGGLQKPISGKISYASADPEGKNKLPLAVSVVLTDRITSANLTVRELITFGRYPHLSWTLKLAREDISIVEKAIDNLNISSLVDRKIYQLSDGQMQMAMIARALAQDTRLMLLDEPTAHLDLNNRVDIMNLLRRIAHQMGKAILVATHELDLALQTADLIWLTGNHENIGTGIPEDLVLNGSFDQVFKFKGFDLKTGKVRHEPFRGVSITLSGDGHVYLWTKNALERNGYLVTSSKGPVEVQTNEAMSWNIVVHGKTKQVESILELLKALQTFAEP
jgi:cobalamin transport system ATP-binding protein